MKYTILGQEYCQLIFYHFILVIFLFQSTLKLFDLALSPIYHQKQEICTQAQNVDSSLPSNLNFPTINSLIAFFALID